MEQFACSRDTCQRKCFHELLCDVAKPSARVPTPDTEQKPREDLVEQCPPFDAIGLPDWLGENKIRTNVRKQPFLLNGRFPTEDYSMSSSSTNRVLEQPSSGDSRFDRRLGEILDYATEIFATKGYEGASMRDLSRLSGISLAGLYYYFESKEKLLYFIQQHTFNTIMERLREQLADRDDPEARIRVFVQNHVSYSVTKQKAMKVLAHEDDVLKDGYGTELAATKREYYRICVGLVEDLARAEGLKFVGPNAGATGGISTRTAVMGLFGMMNWLYTWYSPRVDPGPETIAREMSDIFLRGVRAEKASDRKPYRETSLSGRPGVAARPKAKGTKRKPTLALAAGRTRR
jgi:AcrR family transcriptional regulator